jgi:ribosomal protein S18 acetylase RimI-like enzyme
MIAAMRSAFRGIVPQQNLEWPDSAANWKRGLTNGLGAGIFLDVAQTQDGLVIGYAMGGPSTVDPAYQGELIHIHVLPDYQRQGIGGLLVRHVARRLAAGGIHSMCVKVMHANPNRTFYERLGGHYVSEHPYDWDGVILPECVYGWADTRTLIEA